MKLMQRLEKREHKQREHVEKPLCCWCNTPLSSGRRHGLCRVCVLASKGHKDMSEKILPRDNPDGRPMVGERIVLGMELAELDELREAEGLRLPDDELLVTLNLV